ncbi:hypothetical protein P7C70_g5218, partial [Phenoliferia sp. Uapishka_3]
MHEVSSAHTSPVSSTVSSAAKATLSFELEATVRERPGSDTESEDSDSGYEGSEIDYPVSDTDFNVSDAESNSSEIELEPKEQGDQYPPSPFDVTWRGAVRLRVAKLPLNDTWD